jgi:hypothetical protein
LIAHLIIVTKIITGQRKEKDANGAESAVILLRFQRMSVAWTGYSYLLSNMRCFA